jgi:RES domain-containing protein
MHRLAPSQYNSESSVLAEICDDDAMLADVFLLDGATNDRVQGERQGLSGIGSIELVYGIPNAEITRAAFLHASPYGSRFNDATRGAWYAAESLETALAEVTCRKARNLADIVVPEMPRQQPDEEIGLFDDWLADFHCYFHILHPVEAFAKCLLAEPFPACYAASQQLAWQLIDGQSNGILYPSVRQKNGLCLACFRPPLVCAPRLGARYEIQLKLAGAEYEIYVREF